jgi:CRISPR-associated exonuclease Cas4
MNTEEQTIPLSALQHWLYCPRQCALIHNEQVWAENRFTAEGQLLHKKANEGPDEHRAAGSILRHLSVSSEKLGITGICDIVEKSRDGRYTPVEYKRGKPKAHRADEVQVCAQALCLEEMFSVEIPNALIFYGTTRRRTEVPIDETLRSLTLATIAAVHEMKRNGLTPLAEYEARKCDACSLIDLCEPRALRLKRGAASWFQSRLNSEASADPSSLEFEV